MTAALSILPREMAHMLREIDRVNERLAGAIRRFDHAECPIEQMVESDYAAWTDAARAMLREEVDATIKAAFGVTFKEIQERM